MMCKYVNIPVIDNLFGRLNNYFDKSKTMLQKYGRSSDAETKFNLYFRKIVKNKFT